MMLDGLLADEDLIGHFLDSVAPLAIRASISISRFVRRPRRSALLGSVRFPEPSRSYMFARWPRVQLEDRCPRMRDAQLLIKS